MTLLRSIQKNKWFNWLVGIMGLLAIPLLGFNLVIAEPIDKIFAFVELAMVLLLFGTFVQLAAREPWQK